MRSLFYLLALASALSLAASTARADMIQIDFDLGASTISALGGAIVVPPDGSIGAASATIFVPGMPSGTVSLGAASVSGLTISTISVNGTVGGVATITGPATAAQVGSPALGTLASLGQLVLTNPMFMVATGIFQCTGNPFICAAFPLSFSGTQTINAPVTINIGNINSPGNATATGSIVLSLGGQVATLNLVGQEVSRMYVPEPGRVLQLGAAAALLVGLVWYRRR